MNPHKMNKVDVKSMSEQDQKAFKLYGKLPAKTPLTMMQKDRKFFDSGDYAMSKAGKNDTDVPIKPGTAFPTPENVPHAALPSRHNSISGGVSGSQGQGQANNFSPGASPPTSTGPGQGQDFSPFGQLDRAPSHEQKSHVGVGISPDATSEAVDMPTPATGGGTPVGHHHGRRLSESHARISPPGTMREGASPVSSYPIERHAGLGSSPVKSSALAKRLDEEA